MPSFLARLRHVFAHPITTVRGRIQRRQGFVRDPHGLQRRAYRCYDHYLAEQKAKLDVNGAAWLAETERRYEARLCAQLEKSGLVTRGVSVLCLGARLGAEVRAFRSLGAFAVGIDLNPGPQNDAVCYGDFHHLAYADQSVGIVFTNALDHVFDFDRTIAEIARVLIHRGLFVTEIVKGNASGTPYGYYDAIGWTDVEPVVAAIEAQGFMRQTVTAPDDRGRHWVVLQRT